MSDQQILEWLESEVDYMQDVVTTIEDGDLGMEETADMLGGLEDELRLLRRAILAQ